MNNEHVRTFVEAIHWTNFHTISELALDAGISNNESHSAKKRYTLRERRGILQLKYVKKPDF